MQKSLQNFACVLKPSLHQTKHKILICYHFSCCDKAPNHFKDTLELNLIALQNKC